MDSHVILAALPLLVSFLCMSCGSGPNLRICTCFGEAQQLSLQTHTTSLCIQGFYLWLYVLPTLSKSHKPKGNIKSQLLICLLSTALFPFIWSPCMGSFWHLKGVCFEVRVSQTILITPVAHFSHTGLNGGKRTQAVVLYNFWHAETVISLE